MKGRGKQYSSPLSVAFHSWKDQCTPMLDFTCFHSVEWNKQPIPFSILWSDSCVTSILFGGTKSGTIIAYKIISQKKKIIDVFPICLICGHHTSITSITDFNQVIYNKCIASLSKEGTVSIISVNDLTIVQQKERLFSENSSCLARHNSNHDILLASQVYGTIEVASLSQGTILYKITGFPSTIRSISLHGTMHSVSCADGSVKVISAGENDAGYTYSVSPLIDNFNVISILSPELSFLLIMAEDKWILQESGKKSYVSQMPRKNDSYINCGWLNKTVFYIQTFSGKIEIYEATITDKTKLVFDVLNCNDNYLFAKKKDSTTRIEPIVVQEAQVDSSFEQCTPKLIFETQFAMRSVTTPFAVTREGFIALPLGKSVLEVRSKSGSFVCNLSDYFTSKYKARCAIGDPIQHEARIGADYSIYKDDFENPIGVHKGAFMLYSPPVAGNKFISFAKDGSIKIWTNERVVDIKSLCEPVNKVKFFQERTWICCIAKFSFVVIDAFSDVAVTLCTNHGSPIVDVTYEYSVFQAITESSEVYAWSVDGELVSQRRVTNNENKCVRQVLDMHSMTKSRSTPLIASKSEVKQFSKVVNLNIPNCQTFALVLNVGEFVTAFDSYDTLDVRNDPQFLPLKLLWTAHNGKSMFGDIPVLGSFIYAPAGDNYSVTLPISFKTTQSSKLIAQKRYQSVNTLRQNVAPVKQPSYSKLMRNDNKKKIVATNSIAFNMSPHISAVHACAASAAGQCFVSSTNDDSLSIISALSQTATTQQLRDSVPPSLFSLAVWLYSPSPNLRVIVINVITEIVETYMKEEQASRLISEIQNKFNDWRIILPFIFIISNRFNVSIFAIKEAATHIIPTCIDQPELLDNLISCFKVFTPYLDMKKFFGSLLEAVDKGIIEENKIIRFALVSPADFFDAIKGRNAKSIVTLFLERWLQPDINIILNLIKDLAKEEKKDKDGSGAYQQIFEVMEKKILPVGACKDYVACGDNDGMVYIIERGTSNVLWKFQLFQCPIDYLTVAPSGQRIVVYSRKYSQIIWITTTKGKAKEMFEVAETVNVELADDPVASQWKSGDAKITLFSKSATVFQGNAPNISFFKRLF